MAPSVDSITYELNEKVLCFHMDMMYDAKIIDVGPPEDDDSGETLYRVHYRGWKNTWDDWVTADRMRKMTDENRQLAHTLMNQAKEAQRQANATAKAGKKAAAAAAAAAVAAANSVSGSSNNLPAPTLAHAMASSRATTGSISINSGFDRDMLSPVGAVSAGTMDSARGSEERGMAFSASMNGRGAPRRSAREYDLESVSIMPVMRVCELVRATKTPAIKTMRAFLMSRYPVPMSLNANCFADQNYHPKIKRHRCSHASSCSSDMT